MVVTNRIRQTDKGLFVDLFGEIQIGYDEERDILYLSTEGEYIRTEEWKHSPSSPLKNPIIMLL